jgi:hypothetical protein
MPTRDTLHRLIDELPESELMAAERFLCYLRATTDPVLRALLEAPLDDEPETEGERRAVQEAREELARGEVRTLAEIDQMDPKRWVQCLRRWTTRRPRARRS